MLKLSLRNQKQLFIFHSLIFFSLLYLVFLLFFSSSFLSHLLFYWIFSPTDFPARQTGPSMDGLDVPCPTPMFKAQIPALRLKYLPRGLNPTLEAQIPALRRKSQPRGSNPSLEAQIPVSRLKSKLQGSNRSLKDEIG